MLRKLNTYLITHYPAIWRSKIVYILFATILLSIITPLNNVDIERLLQENQEKVMIVSNKISSLKDKQKRIESQNLKMQTTFFEIKKISIILEERQGYNSVHYEVSEEDLHKYRRYDTAKLRNLYAKQTQILFQQNTKDLKTYLSNLKKIENLQNTEYELTQTQYQYIEVERFSRNTIYYSIFVWILFVFLWLYIQYLSPVYLGKYSFFEVFKTSVLNFASIFIFLIPLLLLVFFTVENSYEAAHYSYKSDSQNMYLIHILRIGYLFLLPIVFISVFIRQYSFGQMIITILMGIACLFCLGFFMNVVLKTSSKEFIVLVHVFYILILLYSLFKVYRKKHGAFSKILILLVLGVGHLFVGFLHNILVFSTQQSENSFYFSGYTRSTEMIFIQLYDDYALSISNWLTLYASSFIFLMLLTWYFSRALQQPRVRR